MLCLLIPGFFTTTWNSRVIVSKAITDDPVIWADLIAFVLPTRKQKRYNFLTFQLDSHPDTCNYLLSVLSHTCHTVTRHYLFVSLALTSLTVDHFLWKLQNSTEYAALFVWLEFFEERKILTLHSRQAAWVFTFYIKYMSLYSLHKIHEFLVNQY